MVVHLLKDRRCQWGVECRHPDQKDRSIIGTLYPYGGPVYRPPVWVLSQWHGLYPIDDDTTVPITLPDGGIEYSTVGKRFVCGPKTAMTLGVNGLDRGEHTADQTDKLKTTIKLDQDLIAPRLSQMSHLRFVTQARLTKADVVVPGRGAAIGFAGLHIRNADRARKELVSFVMPLYDSRERTRRPVRVVDLVSPYFIYGTGTAVLMGSESLHDRSWVSIDVDLLPLILDALKTVWGMAQYAHYSSDLSDWTVSQFVFSWEMSADMDVELTVKGYALTI